MKTVELKKRNNLVVADSDVIQVFTNQPENRIWIKLMDSEEETGLEMSIETFEFLYKKMRKVLYLTKYHKSREKYRLDFKRKREIKIMEEELIVNDIPTTKKKAVKSD